jgi:gas vesicle protein
MRDRRHYREEEGQHLSTFAKGIAIGGIIGAGIALLYAPKKGCELRRDLQDKYEDLSERAEDLASTMTSRGRRMAKDFSCASADFMDSAREKGEDIKDIAQNRFEDLCDWADVGFRLWNNLKRKR